MSFIAFIILCVVVCAIASIGCWALRRFLPGHPVTVDYIIWGVALFIILVNLFGATGLVRYDPQIPRLP